MNDHNYPKKASNRSASAFPRSPVMAGNNFIPGSGGMDLRDYFAARVMEQDIAMHGLSQEATFGDMKERARQYYRMANAMMDAKEEL